MARTALEARLAKDADKLECLIQAREYQAQGHEDVPPWIETSAAALCTPLGPPACRGMPAGAPRQWWNAFVESYPKPFKVTRRPSAQDHPSDQERPGSSEPEEARRA